MARLSSDRLNNMSAVEGSVKKPLGRLCWYTVHDRDISSEELNEKFTESGLDPRYMPKPIRPVDAFRRATTELEESSIPVEENFLNILVREVKCDAASVTRQIVKEIVDSKNVKLTYEVAAAITYDRKSETISGRNFVDDEFIGRKLNMAKTLYRKYKSTYDGSHIRRLIRDALADMKPTSVRPSGGVYFVPEKYGETLERLQKLAQLLKCEFFSIPLIDNAEMRDMVCQKFIEQSGEQIAKMAELLRAGGTSPAEMTQIFNESKALLEQIKEYEAMLEINLNEIKERAEFIKRQMVSLLEA